MTASPSEDGALAQAETVFLHGCGLPALWAGQPQWRILETDFGLGLNFLVAWHVWQNDPSRCGMLHFLSVEAYPVGAADILQAAQSHPQLLPLATQLAAQWWGLLPGFHRLVFEGGHVLLTLGIGDAKKLLRDQSPGFAADSVFLGGSGPQLNPDLWDVPTFKAVARCARRGSRVATWTVAQSVQDSLKQAGFLMQKVPGIAPKRDNLQGLYDPPWLVKKRLDTGFAAQAVQWPAELAQTAMVIGAGLAGAAVAASLTRRGWQVVVLEAGPAAASGASSLPAGVLAAHVSRGDTSALSELSRCGVRATLGQAEALLTAGQDWQCTGVLQRLGLDAADGTSQAADFYRPGVSADFQADWSRPATVQESSQAGFSASGLGSALWHPRAGWIKPGSLVKAWLASPFIRLQTASRVVQLLPSGTGWQALDANGDCLAQANLVVLAAGFDSQTLALNAPAARSLPLQPIRGQVSWGFLTAAGAADLPPFPVNGLGSLIAGVPLPGSRANPDTNQLAWLAGASYARDNRDLQPSRADHAQNQLRLQTLVPKAAKGLAHFFDPTLDKRLHSWIGIRCVSPNRLPIVTPLGTSLQFWVCTAMGSRGLTLAALCAELLAARLHGEPLAIGRKLADALCPDLR